MTGLLLFLGLAVLLFLIGSMVRNAFRGQDGEASNSPVSADALGELEVNLPEVRGARGGPMSDENGSLDYIEQQILGNISDDIGIL